MRWRGRRKSDNVVDRRGESQSVKRGVGGGVMIFLVLAGLFFGKDVQQVLSLFVGGQGSSYAQSSGENQGSVNWNDDAANFVKVILAETEDTWDAVFEKIGQRYQRPQLVMYEGQVNSACGVGSAASGPFYCPGDYKIYIDLSFLNDLKRMGAPGDFAFAYVIAHEVGHHVQNITGIASKVRQQQSQVSKVQSNALSVKLELQADCLAGIWINHTEKRNAILDEGDIEEGLQAAEAVGDDRLMAQAGRAPRREAFTHGSSQERMNWFRRGMSGGTLNSCDTFSN